MNSDAPAQPRRRTGKRTAIWSAAVLLLVGGGTVGYSLVTGNSEPDCDGLLNNASIQRILGPHRSDMSCTDLGAALRDAATGPTPGQHTLAQARNMRETIRAISDDVKHRQDLAIAPGLRKPIASAVADYVRDTQEILVDVNEDYSKRRAPWRDGHVVRMPAGLLDVTRVMRAVADDPSAYANLRLAQTHRCAIGLARVPTKATEDDDVLELRARECGSALGFLDGIADDIPESERGKWQTDVLAHLTAHTSKPPSYRRNPVEHLTSTWRQGLVRDKPDRTFFLKQQASDLVATWAVGRGLDPDDAAVDYVQNGALNAAHTGVRTTENAVKCTRQPEEQLCP
ncbi:hypothetical protein AB0C96_09320 [Streptomyces sp. NPDC048506]|uniref:hypothetical protein n=1 Tax=Streptomyces sp. NPDC048506 TaxID=3155028 RepID=UPI0034264D67